MEVLCHGLLRMMPKSVGTEKAAYFPWVRPRLKFAESVKTSPKANVSSPWGGRAEGIPRDSCRVETVHGEAKDKSDPRLGSGARPLMTFPWELGTVTDGHGSHWHYDQSTLQSILSAEGCVTGPCLSQCMATEQVAFSRTSTEDPTSNTQLLPPTFYHRTLCFLEKASFLFFSCALSACKNG